MDDLCFTSSFYVRVFRKTQGEKQIEVPQQEQLEDKKEGPSVNVYVNQQVAQ